MTFSLQIRDLELEIDEEKRRHAESVKILRKKERSLKEVIIQSEEDHKNVQLLQEALEKVNQKVNIYKRQLQEQVSVRFFFLNIIRSDSVASLKRFEICAGGHEHPERVPGQTVPTRTGSSRRQGRHCREQFISDPRQAQELRDNNLPRLASVRGPRIPGYNHDIRTILIHFNR